METVPAKFPILAALGGKRSNGLREMAAAAALVAVLAALWAWLILGVGAPASATVRRLSPPGAPAGQLALRNADPSQRAP